MLQDSWWFGVPLLARGPLIALPIVLATDYPAVQTVWVTFILLSFLACQALAWPWKALSSISLELGLKPFKIGCLWLGLPRYIYTHTQFFQIVWNHFAIFSGTLIASESNRLWERITA